jgi:cytochrome c553
MASNLSSGDREYGKHLSSECRACHSASKESNKSIPSLSGKSFEYLAIALEEYKSKTRKSLVIHAGA